MDETDQARMLIATQPTFAGGGNRGADAGAGSDREGGAGYAEQNACEANGGVVAGVGCSSAQPQEDAITALGNGGTQ
jgi:hypothetical protein